MSQRYTEEKRVKPNPSLRVVGFSLLMIAIGVLSWDVYGLCLTMKGVKFSGIAHIWQSLDKESFAQMQNAVIAHLSYSAWYSFLSPLMSAPLALIFGLPGLWMVRRYSPGIEVRAPTIAELQMISAGMNPRRAHKR